MIFIGKTFTLLALVLVLAWWASILLNVQDTLLGHLVRSVLS